MHQNANHKAIIYVCQILILVHWFLQQNSNDFCFRVLLYAFNKVLKFTQGFDDTVITITSIQFTSNCKPASNNVCQTLILVNTFLKQDSNYVFSECFYILFTQNLEFHSWLWWFCHWNHLTNNSVQQNRWNKVYV